MPLTPRYLGFSDMYLFEGQIEAGDRIRPGMWMSSWMQAGLAASQAWDVVKNTPEFLALDRRVLTFGDLFELELALNFGQMLGEGNLDIYPARVPVASVVITDYTRSYDVNFDWLYRLGTLNLTPARVSLSDIIDLDTSSFLGDLAATINRLIADRRLNL